MTILDLPESEPHVIKPLIDLKGDGFVDIVWPEDKITAQLEGLWRAGGRFETVLRILHTDLGTIHAPSRINLLSTSARTDLRRSLDQRFPQIGWGVRIDQIADYADKVYRSDLKVEVLGSRLPRPLSYLARPLLETGQITALGAEAGTGKSMLALTIALEIGGYGPLIPGVAALVTGETLYLDWEADYDTHANRQSAILQGAGKPLEAKPVRHIYMTGMLLDQADRILCLVRSFKPVLVIVDSVGKAVMGHVNEPEFVLPLMDVCRSMKTTILLIGHLAKHDSDGSLIGSVFWFTDPRQGWQLAKSQEPGQSESQLALIHKKSNNSMLQKPLGFRVEIANNGDALGAIRYYTADVAKNPELERYAVAVDRLTQFLLTNGRSQVAQIAEATGLPLNTVRTTLRRHRDTRFIMFGSGRTAEWAVTASDTSRTPNQIHVSGGLNTPGSLKKTPLGMYPITIPQTTDTPDPMDEVFDALKEAER